MNDHSIKRINYHFTFSEKVLKMSTNNSLWVGPCKAHKADYFLRFWETSLIKAGQSGRPWQVRKLSDFPSAPEDLSQSRLQLFLMDVPCLTDKSAINCVTKTCGMHDFTKKCHQRMTCITQYGQLDKSHFSTEDSASCFATCP